MNVIVKVKLEKERKIIVQRFTGGDEYYLEAIGKGIGGGDRCVLCKYLL